MKGKILFLLFLLMSTYAYADGLKVKGKVVNEKGEAVIGAAVTVKDMPTIGISTDVDGNFVLEVPDGEHGVLVVSYIGFKSKYVPLNGRTILNITMQQEVTSLDEVVVVGYGSMRKSDLTGSVASIKTSEAEAATATSFDKMLQGKAAGVLVSTGSAAPGGSVSVRIRGTSSLRGNNTPLYVVDGVIVSNLGDTADPMKAGVGGGNSRAEEQNPLSFISPQDIENIEILKDASATAIYGSQGANGVVLITTKKGRSAKPSIMVSSNVTISKMMNQIPMLSAPEYVEFYNSFLEEDEKRLTLDGLTPVNWQDESTRVAVSQNYRASVSGKSNKTGYFFALGYSKQEGVIRKTDIGKYDIRLNLDQELGKYLSLKSNTSFSTINTSMTSGTDKLANSRSSVIRHMISFKPYRGEASAESSGEYDEDLTTPDAWFTDYDDDSEENFFNTNFSLDIKPLKWLTVRLSGNMVYKNKERSMWFGKQTFNGAQANGKAGVSKIDTRAYNFEGLLMFNHSFGKHSLNGTAGIVYNKKETQLSSLTGEDFFSEDLRADGISQAAVQYPYYLDKRGEQLFSVLARAVYNYDNRYVATVTFRADGSSNFDKKNRFSYFPSFALAWRMNRESWLRDCRSISNLKLRAGWGQVGNQAISPYQTLGSYNNVENVKPDGSSEPGIVPARIPNPNLKWETSEQYNVGLDLGMFDQRFTFTVDAYHKTTKDLLQQIALPYAGGYKSMWINNGKIQNKGLEFSIGGTPIQKKDWEWTIGGNISFTRNTIKELGLAASDFGMIHNVSGYWGENVGNNTFTKFPANAFLVGHSIGLFMGYETRGIMQEDLYNSAEYQAHPLKMNGRNIEPGDVLYVDQNGDGVVDDRDRVILGNPNPDFMFALNTSLRYKNWTLDMAFNGVVGNEIVNANLIDENDVKEKTHNVRCDAFRQAWTPQNKSNSYPRLGYVPMGVLDDRIIEDGSYLKMSHLSLSYRLDFKKSKAIKNISFNFTASNLFTITSYSGFDPDVNTFVNDVDRMGIDLTSYPSARSFTFGIIANF